MLCRGLSKETELWDGEPGFSKARWNLWAGKFEELAREDWLSRDGRDVAEEAARIIWGYPSRQSR